MDSKVTEASNHLGFKLYNLLAEKGHNLFISPFSMSTALAMLYCGCRHETAMELRGPLGYNVTKLKVGEIEYSFLNLLKSIEERTEGCKLACANCVVYDKRFSVKEEYKTLLEESFKATCVEVNFMKASEAAVKLINEWVSEKTNGMIPQLLPGIDPNTFMVLLNAIYFKGSWRNPFQEQDTFPQYFYNNGVEDNAKHIDMMHMIKFCYFLQTKSFKALQLPYKDEDMSMLILLPNARDGIASLEKSLSASFLLDVLRNMHNTHVQVAFPKFRLEYSKSLVDQFKLMGVQKIFQARDADFGGINDSKELFVADIFHKAVIEVNERGTEAAAVFRKLCGGGSIEDLEKFIVDHPFVFLIYDSKRNLILFMGRVEEL